MTDLSEFEVLENSRGPRCSVRLTLDSLDDVQAGKLQAAIAAPHITGSAIAKWCKQRDIHLSEFSVCRHRRGACSCE